MENGKTNCSISIECNTVLQKEITADTHNNTDASLKHTEWKKTYTEENILFALIYVKF